MEKHVRFIRVISDDGYKMGQVKFDGFRTKMQYTALGYDGSRLGEFSTEYFATNAVLNQDVPPEKLVKNYY